MNKRQTSRSWAVIFVFILLVFAFDTPAQKPMLGDILPPVLLPTEELSTYPFDFNDAYYLSKGVNPDAIIARRNGNDGLSVLTKETADTPINNGVRVLVTIPAYNQYGEPMFWYPLGDLTNDSFTPDKLGVLARQTANRFPVYVFPDRRIANFSAFTNTRQSAVIDNSALFLTKAGNPLGLRQVFIVGYTKKAFGEEGKEIMAYFGKKNGYAIDDTPILKTVDDIMFMAKNEFVSFESFSNDIAAFNAPYTISPVITAKGAIAKDAFLWMSTWDGQWSTSEEMFMWIFECTKKTGDWCQ